VKIGPYDVLGELGRGAMGVVYRVRSPSGEELALKLLLRAEGEKLARFDRERRLLAEFTVQDGFVPLLDAGTLGERPYLVMPLVPGGTLRDRLLRGPMTVAHAVELGRKLAHALGSAHERGIVHRDLKPENVLFTANGDPLIADLGLAKHFDREAPGASQSVSLSRDGVLRGTPGYAAPEQLSDARSAGPAADVFALGAILYECFAGEPAFQGDNTMELIAHFAQGAKAPPLRRRNVPRRLARIVERCLSRDPERRFADGEALAVALEGQDEGRGHRFLVAFLVLLALATASVAGIAWARRDGGHDPAGPASAGRDPLLAHEWDVRAAAKGKAGDLDGEIADETKAIELDPTLATAWAHRGVARGMKGDRDGEIADETKAIELAPTLAWAWGNRGDAWSSKRDFDRAIADDTRAIELDPALAQAWCNRANARESKGDAEGAIADATRAIEIEPGLARAWQIRGVARDKTDVEGEIADETRAIELNPRYAVAWADRGWARSRKGDWDGVIADSTKAIEFNPSLGQAWSNRGWAKGAKGDLEGEIADATRALEVEPGLAHPWSHLGWARFKKGDFAAGLADLDEAVKRFPREAWFHVQRALARALSGDRPGALDDLGRAHELAPDDAYAVVWLAGLGADEALLQPYASRTGSIANVVRFYLREITRDELLAEAAKAATDHEKAERLCEARGYMGLLAEREGDLARARAEYEACVASGATQWLQYTWARVRLQQIH
jgi:tetratricopeptide (TPR) repeat protein